MGFIRAKRIINFVAPAIILFLLLQIFAFFPNEAKADGVITFIGHGYGHGVGLSMTSVYFMSRDDPRYSQNGGYQDIVRYFYQGTTLHVNDPRYNDNNQVLAEGTDGVIRSIPMGDYLRHLAEEPDTWPREGLRTLMLAARTYAWYKMEKNGYIPKGGQAYNQNIDPTSPYRQNINAAVRDTAGQVLTYNNNLIVAAYSASAGGYTARFEDVWQPNTFSFYPYAERVPAPWDAGGANYNWQKAIPTGSIESAYPSIGGFRGLQVLSRAGAGDWGGRATKLRILGSSGNVDVNGWDFAGRMGLKSNYFTFTFDYSRTAIYTMLSSQAPAMNQVWDSGINNWDWFSSSAATGDFNNDGLDDIAVLYRYGGAQSGLWVFLNNGAGGFNPPAQWWNSGPGNWDWTGSKLAAGDFNADGRDDILVFYGYASTRQTKAWVFTSTGGAFNSPAQWWDSGPNNWDWTGSKVMAGNVNNDARDDLVILYGYSSTRQTKAWVFTSTGGAFNSPAQWWDSGPNNWDWAGSKALLNDYNGDNTADLMIYYHYNNAKTIAWLLSSTSTSFNSPSTLWDSGQGNWDWLRSAFLSGRFDLDNRADTAALYNLGNL